MVNHGGKPALSTLVHRGGANGVTGSCHQLYARAGPSLLIDCGLFQGQDADPARFDQMTVDFDVDSIKAVVITHVHIDHVGRLPYLLAAGFDGPVICSIPSARLLPLVIEDALKIGFTRDRALIERFLERLEQQVVALEYDRWHSVVNNQDLVMRVKLRRAGHILGSSFVEVGLREPETGQRERVVFSGDLGAANSPLLPAPTSPAKADVLVLEATYGGRRHERREGRTQALKKAIDAALDHQGTVIIPAFSIGRTQELLYALEGIVHRAAGRGRWGALEIIVDSPLAARFTRVYRTLKPYWDAEAQTRVRAGRHPLDFESLYTVDSHEAHLRTVTYLAQSGRPAVVIAASGMCAGGRVVNYLKAMLEDTRHQVLFVGYQGEGTPGRDIQRYGPAGGWVELEGERFTIRAGVTSISGYSAHADEGGLLRFVAGMRRWPREVRLVHGDSTARLALKSALEALAQKKGKALTVTLPDNQPCD
ncbi:MBL fold metallo-hydrolase [Halomonas sp. GD1P12]|uniref:MBL fold metallo-hydrolase n=1 Tax=Halomonas sp. GD1P12 TaxID=2982691 RepID=UPI0021E4C117|nr:MBL fold metallo-hydrolase [Halomonas sp. GD1P12]UYF98739.1 MBL fold metallo-hydrolase [Halomonas sp. GD1P12]